MCTAALSLIDSGAVDVLELGVPFSDPIADGQVIQAAVGFAISGPDHVREVLAMGAHGAIVGSVIVDLIAKGTIAEELNRFVRSLKQATRALLRK